ncbi:unnamed protein product [Lupinus luteus]|uniref:40S ribosomal protein S21 n=1 Tax=Lupinus luteus TaxID=3873 RepID=A0AAV1YLX4_LUPLU
MQNEEGQITELYIPRKCSATNRLITSKDHASVQINVGHLDESGVYNGNFSTFALSGYIRAQVIVFCFVILNYMYFLIDVIVFLLCSSFPLLYRLI